MKITKILIFIYLSCSWLAHADTYVWEDYDDFSGSSLDTNKWNYITFNGGNQPYISNGKMLLESDGKNLNATPQNEPKWDAFVEDVKQWGDPEVFAYPSTDGIYGLEASLTIPQGIENGTFVDLSFFEVKAVAQEFEMKGLGIGFKYENDTFKISIDTEGVEVNFEPIDASIGRTYKFSITHNNLTYSLFVDDQKVAQVNIDNFEPNLISLSAYNEEEKSFSIEVEEVRVLRKKTTTSLDGSVLMLSSTDDVSETLAFENGTFTSTFTDPEEGTMVTANQTYILDQNSDNSFKITLSDGDTYEFDASTNTGTLIDYEDGVADDSGSWNFNFSRHDWEDYDDFSGGSLDPNKWDIAKWDGGNFPVLEGGMLKFTGQPNSSSSVNVATNAMLVAAPGATVGDSTSLSPHSNLEFIESQDLNGIELTFSMPSNVPNEMGFGLYAVDYGAMLQDVGQESSIRFSLDLWAENGKAFLEYDAINASSGVEEEIYKSISFNTTYIASFIRNDSQISFYMNGELVGEFPYSEVGEYFIVRAMNEINQPFTTYLENVRVLRRSKEEEDPEPLTVVSDPNGQVVVVWEDDEDGWIGATIKYENGMQKASIGITDQLGNNLEVNHPYIIDENGMVKVTEDTAFQYYQVTAVENGVITTADDSSFPLSDTSKFFTTRAAAEDFYYSKVNPKDWMWFDHYPWVYSNEEQDWLYFYPSGSKLLYWSNKGKAWRQFN